jgi:hypothetical protein
MVYMKFSGLVACFCFGLLGPASAAVAGSSQVVVNEVFVFSEFGGGDVGFLTSSPIAGCEAGYWLRVSDPGFKSLYAMLMMAYATKSVVRVSAYDDSLWPGSNGRYCRVQWLNAE